MQGAWNCPQLSPWRRMGRWWRFFGGVNGYLRLKQTQEARYGETHAEMQATHLGPPVFNRLERINRTHLKTCRLETGVPRRDLPQFNGALIQQTEYGDSPRIIRNPPTSEIRRTLPPGSALDIGNGYVVELLIREHRGAAPGGEQKSFSQIPSTNKTVSSQGPWAPRTKVCSMSAVFDGPAMKTP